MTYEGLHLRDEYPEYISEDKGKCKIKEDSTLVKAENFVIKNFESQNSLANIVAERPVITLMNASSQSFRFYKNGILSNAERGDQKQNHAVIIVGYGEEKDGSKYWLIRNSFGPNWGENGYFKVEREETGRISFGIGEIVIYLLA
jgi:KDEL-tailed cysteine endopeptidase